MSAPAGYLVGMGVVQAKIQTVEDIYRLVRTAVMSKRPIRAIYHGWDRWFCPHRLGRNHEGQIRVLCYQYGGETGSGLQAAGSPANWRCVCRSACPAALARPSIYAAKRLCCGPGEERRDPTKQFYIKMFFFNTVILSLGWIVDKHCATTREYAAVWCSDVS